MILTKMSPYLWIRRSVALGPNDQMSLDLDEETVAVKAILFEVIEIP